MTHGTEACMDNLVIHREHKNIFEMPEHQRPKLGFCLAVNVPGIAWRRRKGLRLQRWHADDDGATWLEGVDNAPHHGIRFMLRDVFEHIKRIDAIVTTRKRLVSKIDDNRVESPTILHPRLRVFDV